MSFHEHISFQWTGSLLLIWRAKNNNGETSGRRYAARRVLGDVILTNVKVHNAIEGCELIVDACVRGEEERANHEQCVRYYRNMIQILKKSHEFMRI
jgi:hypothetical protein